MRGFGVKVVVILVLAGVLGVVNYALNPRVAVAMNVLRERAQAERQRIDIAGIVAREPVLWVDARGDDAFAKGRVQGAVHLPPESFDERLGAVFERWEPGQTMVVYCDGAACNASYEVAARLRQAFGDAVAADAILVFEGGWAALPAQWKEGAR